MIRNYFKVAWRNLLKNKIYSFINIFGLAIGMAVTIMISLWIFDELNFNKEFKNYDSIAQVFQSARARVDRLVLLSQRKFPHPQAVSNRILVSGVEVLGHDLARKLFTVLTGQFADLVGKPAERG